MYIYGLDPAEHGDFFGIVIHRIEAGKPKLHTLRKMRNVTYPDVQRMLKQELFLKYPPYYIVIDYSNEKTFSEMLVEKYGDRVEPVNFTQLNKLMLKQDGLKLLQLGYEWPTSQNAQVQSWIDELKDQLKHEQMLETPSGKITFDHPEGEHNDLAIAWELSCHGCLKFIDKSGRPVAVGYQSDADYWSSLKSRQEQFVDRNPRLQQRLKGLEGLSITDVKIDIP